MEFLAFAVSIPGITVLLVFWILWIKARRRRFLRALEAHSCCICGGSFADVLVEDLGRPSPEAMAKLDAFQRRFAARSVLCQECGSLNLCTSDGTPFKGLTKE
jgi:hypothetical protein